MFHNYLSKMYEIPSYVYFIAIFIVIAVWAFLDWRYSSKKSWTVTNRVLFLLAVLSILTITIFVRSVQQSGVYLNPLYILELAKTYPDVYNEMVLNIVLFLPFGLTFPFAFEIKYSSVLVLAFALVFSVAIEYTQYTFSIGFFDVSDIILNFIGSLLGVISSVISSRIKSKDA